MTTLCSYLTVCPRDSAGYKNWIALAIAGHFIFITPSTRNCLMNIWVRTAISSCRKMNCTLPAITLWCQCWQSSNVRKCNDTGDGGGRGRKRRTRGRQGDSSEVQKREDGEKKEERKRKATVRRGVKEERGPSGECRER